MGLLRTAMVMFALAAIGCSDDEAPPSGQPAFVAECPEGEVLRLDGSCAAPAGIPGDLPCPPGEWPLDDGSCRSAGLTPDMCAPGFQHDGIDGCEGILPEAECPEGMMALPGETTCREVMACGTGPWGDIPVELNSQYVDASYSGRDSDGTATKPWTTIADAVDNAADNAIVAIAAGSYPETVYVSERRIRLWGRCPAMVILTGSGVTTGYGTVAYFSSPGASGSEVHGVTVSNHMVSFGIGVAVVDAVDILIDRVHAIDQSDVGVYAQRDQLSTALTVRSSLVERSTEQGVGGVGGLVTVEDSVIRQTRAGAQGLGVGAVVGSLAGDDAALTLQRSVVETSQGAGVLVQSGDAVVDSVVVRNTTASTNGLSQGRGISVQTYSSDGGPSSLKVFDSVIEDSIGAAIFHTSGPLEAERVTIRGVELEAANEGGGVLVGLDEVAMFPTTTTLRSLSVSGYHTLGIYVGDTEALVESVVVRDSSETVDRGSGIVNISTVSQLMPSSMILRGSVVERVAGGGIFLEGGQSDIDGVVVRDIRFDELGGMGRGVSARHSFDASPVSATIRNSIVSNVNEVGVFVFNGDVTIETSAIDSIRPRSTGEFGDGVTAWAEPMPTRVDIRATRISNSSRAGAAAIGATLSLEDARIDCHPIDLVTSAFIGVSGTLEDRGGNECGCETPLPCRARTDTLAPPPLPEFAP